jgi:hypothetical protein
MTLTAAAIYCVLLVGGFLRSLQFTAYNTLAYGDVSRERMSAAVAEFQRLETAIREQGAKIDRLAAQR